MLADRLERLGRATARKVCRVAGVIAVFAGAFGCLTGLVVLIASMYDPRLVTDYVAEVMGLFTIAIWVIVMGLALALERGDRILRVMLPAISGGAFAWLLVGEPRRGIMSGDNNFALLISIYFGVVYICHLAKDRPLPPSATEVDLPGPSAPRQPPPAPGSHSPTS